MPEAARITWGEGDTAAEAHPELAAACGLERLVLKREDANPTGSHKDRGMAYQASAVRAAAPATRWLVISSSGNAAVSAARAAARGGMRLAAFFAPETDPAKRVALVAEGALSFVTPHALGMAEEVAQARGLPNLRPSTSPLAVPGFQTLLWELDERPTGCQAVFLFASSGTALVGLGRALARSTWQPELHVVQGAGAAPIAGPFDPRPAPPGRRVGALGARKTRRLGEAVRAVRASGGSGWVIGDDEALEAAALLRAHGIPAALEASAALAAAGRAAREGGLRSAVVVISGAERPSPDAAALDAADAACHRPATLAEALAILDAAIARDRSTDLGLPDATSAAAATAAARRDEPT